MPTEPRSPAETQTLAFKDEVRNILQRRTTAMKNAQHSGWLITDTLATHIDDLGLDWTRLSKHTSSSSITDSIAFAMRYAHFKTGREFRRFFDPKSEFYGWKSFKDVLDDKEGERIFHANIDRPSVTLYTDRITSLPYVLNSHFGEKELTGIDLGAGLHTALPLLTTGKHLQDNFPGRERVVNLARPIRMKLGLGVDIQQPETDLDWINICTLGNEATRETHAAFNEELKTIASTRNTDQFPFLTGNIRQAGTIAEIKKLLGKKGLSDQKVDFVLTSFMVHQAFTDGNDLHGFHPVIADLLSDNGLWINLGENFVAGFPPRFKYPTVAVYEKKKGKMKFKGMPFVLGEIGHGIQSVNPHYFLTQQ